MAIWAFQMLLLFQDMVRSYARIAASTRTASAWRYAITLGTVLRIAAAVAIRSCPVKA
jgi:hypothetical protein